MDKQTVSIRGIQLLEDRGFFIAKVEISLLRKDGRTRNNIFCEVRVEGNKEQSFSEIQDNILQEAKAALCAGEVLLQRVSPENLSEFDR